MVFIRWCVCVLMYLCMYDQDHYRLQHLCNSVPDGVCVCGCVRILRYVCTFLMVFIRWCDCVLMYVCMYDQDHYRLQHLCNTVPDGVCVCGCVRILRYVCTFLMVFIRWCVCVLMYVCMYDQDHYRLQHLCNTVPDGVCVCWCVRILRYVCKFLMVFIRWCVCVLMYVCMYDQDHYRLQHLCNSVPDGVCVCWCVRILMYVCTLLMVFIRWCVCVLMYMCMYDQDHYRLQHLCNIVPDGV